MKNNIAVLPGDGIGKEVINEAVKVLKAIGSVFDRKFTFQYGLIGVDAIEKTGDPFPVETEHLCKKAHAVLFGAIGDPKFDDNPNVKVRPDEGLFRMRANLGLYANLRPVKSYPPLYDRSPLKNNRIKNVDFIVIRELTGGIYFGQPRGRSEDGFEAFDTCKYSAGEIERIGRVAFGIAQKRNGRVTVVDKANVLATSRLWRQVIKQLAGDYPDVNLEFMYVDHAAMNIITNPAQFDVIVTENMFGDILTDEASVISGSLGLIPSASIGEESKLFEPIHGSYPEWAGKNRANPIASILSAAMMLEMALNAPGEAELVREAVLASMEKGLITGDIDPNSTCTTSQVGDFIAEYILAKSIDDVSPMTII